MFVSRFMDVHTKTAKKIGVLEEAGRKMQPEASRSAGIGM